jgi:hypothetical protein
MTVRSVQHAFEGHRYGSRRPARPAQLSEASLNVLSGGVDPQKVDEMSHQSALALLHRIHESSDPDLVKRVLTLVDREGVDIIAELWAKSEPDSLPGMMWRLYMLRSWMQSDSDALTHFWDLGEPAGGAASAIAGIDEYPTPDDIVKTADSILSGAFTGDFAVALDRASTFTNVIARGMESMAMRLARQLPAYMSDDDPRAALVQQKDREAQQKQSAQSNPHTRETMEQIAHLRSTAARLAQTSRDFHEGASEWRNGKLL